MTPEVTPIFFLIAAVLNTVAGCLHLWIIYVGADGYRKFGAGEKMAQMAADGRKYPTFLTLGIASALFFFAAMCLSQTSLVPALPLAREILWILTFVYLVRGTVPLVTYPWFRLFRKPFFVKSSIIVLGFALIHFLALMS
ncbi:MAG: hypothetical protein HN725_02320 [Alphaproteobacteria bacterium]|jgi:hypothetical protein|nr:hypothetical protein [Alphaproteobacteria bacterium]